MQLPFGPIAYRANLFSAVMAAAACGLGYLIARQLGAGRTAAWGSSLALATGASFWRSAVFAEVYSLGAAIVAGAVVLLLEWGARGGTRWLLGSVAALALGLGNHLTIVGVAPAFVCYVLLRNRRAVSVRLAAAATLIVLLGVSQYGFIVLRTRQGGTYLESRATTLSGLLGIVRAERFAEQRFAFSPRAVLTDHLPPLASVIGIEVGLGGVLLLLTGTLAAIRARRGAAGLTLGAATGMLAMIVNMSGDLKGFITPVMVLVWPLAAVGLQGAREWLSAAGSPRMAGVVVTSAALVLPIVNVTRNYAEADQSGQTASARFLRSMFGQLPDNAVVVTEDYWSDMAFEYYRVTGEAGPWRGIARVGLDAAEVRGAARAPHTRRVFALGGAAAIFAADGLWFARTPLQGVDLADWLRDLPRGAVLVGATAFVPVPFDPSIIGRPETRRIGRPRTFEAFAFVAGLSRDAWLGDDVKASLAVDDTAMAARLPRFAGSVLAVADARGARIQLDGHALGRVDRGLALAAFTPDGVLLRVLEFHEGEPLQVELPGSVYELRGESSCVEVTTYEWTEVTPALVTGSAVATLKQLESSVIEIEALDGDLQAQSSHLLGDGRTSLTRAQTADGSIRLDWQLTRTGARRPLFRLALDRPAVRARARLKPGTSAAQRICSHRPARELFRAGAREAVLRADFESEAYFGPGWEGAERTPTGTIRRAKGAASLLVPLPLGISCHLVLDGTVSTPVDLAVNGTPVGTCLLYGGSACEIDIPAAVTRDAVNSVRLSTGAAATGARPGPALTFRAARFSCGG